MVDYTTSRPLALVLISTAHMVFTGLSLGEVRNGYQGSNITLEFRFQNISGTSIKSAGLYRNDTQKINECPLESMCSESHVCVFNRHTTLAFYCIANLTFEHNGNYWVTLFMKSSGAQKVQSNSISLIVHKQKRWSTVSPPTANTTESETTGKMPERAFPLHYLMLLGVLAIAILAGSLTWFIRRHRRNTEQRHHDPNPTVQVREEASHPAPAMSPVYSVLDLPKRPQGVVDTSQQRVDVEPSDTEYAVIAFPKVLANLNGSK
ncbi:uncharacterized protein LOC130109866 [Lampris incognitus]|uniref:uncharacterized protein LOC130109866 n=1 Tax=Lampris incognitus TaxID=2546036 RepID=UPI0024B586C1|nr:uncharacterized protein LOC130109866 [Lampris incognitus]